MSYSYKKVIHTKKEVIHTKKIVIHTTKMNYSYIIYTKNELFIYIYLKKQIYSYKEVIHTKKGVIHIQKKYSYHYIQKS